MNTGEFACDPNVPTQFDCDCLAHGWDHSYFDDRPNCNCDFICGDANDSRFVDIDDVVYLINFIFTGGPPPTPYQVGSGDADVSCNVDIDDVVYLITYIFTGTVALHDSSDWVPTCGQWVPVWIVQK